MTFDFYRATSGRPAENIILGNGETMLADLLDGDYSSKVAKGHVDDWFRAHPRRRSMSRLEVADLLAVATRQVVAHEVEEQTSRRVRKWRLEVEKAREEKEFGIRKYRRLWAQLAYQKRMMEMEAA